MGRTHSGRGSAIGFPTVPVIKIASNSRTYARMRDNMDFNAGLIADGEQTIKRLGHREFVPWRIGPVM